VSDVRTVCRTVYDTRVEQYTVPGRCYTRVEQIPGECTTDECGNKCYKQPTCRTVTCQAPPETRSRTVCVPRVVTEQVPYTRYVAQYHTERVPYTVCRRIPYTVTRQVPYTTCRVVTEEHVKMVPSRRCRMVQEEVVRQVPVTTCRMVAEEKVEVVKCRRCRMVTEEQVKMVPVTTCRMVREECVKMVPTTVCERVPVCTVERVCRRVPVKVPVYECASERRCLFDCLRGLFHRDNCDDCSH
jgi:hypothetical protein